MPYKTCKMSGCHKTVLDKEERYCPKHREAGAARDKANERQREQYRGTSGSRGYDYTWQRFAKAIGHDHTSCVVCRENNVPQVSEHFDHVIPFVGLDDPLRLDWENIQGLCQRHHTQKTRILDGEFRTVYERDTASGRRSKSEIIAYCKLRTIQVIAGLG